MEVASGYIPKFNAPMLGMDKPTPVTNTNVSRKTKSRKRVSTRQLERPYLECKWNKCGKIFHTTLELKDHLEDHLGRGNSKYICLWEGCNFGERRKRDHMKSHVRKHHQHIGFYCKQCGMGFVRDQELRQHTCGVSNGTSSPNDSSDDSETVPSTSSPGFPTSPNSSDLDSFQQEQVRRSDYQSYRNGQNPQAYDQTYSLKRERSSDDILSWLGDLSNHPSDQEVILTPTLFTKMDSLMDKFEQDPSCFDEYINLLKPHSSYFKRVRQSIEEFNLSNDEDIVALLEQTQTYGTPQVYTSQPYPSNNVSNQPQYSTQFQAVPPIQSQTPNVSHIEAYCENQAYASGNHQVVYESVVSFSVNGEPTTYTAKKENTDEEEEYDDDDDYVDDIDDDGEEEEDEDQEEIISKLKNVSLKNKEENKARRKVKDYLEFIETLSCFQ